MAGLGAEDRADAVAGNNLFGPGVTDLFPCADTVAGNAQSVFARTTGQLKSSAFGRRRMGLALEPAKGLSCDLQVHYMIRVDSGSFGGINTIAARAIAGALRHTACGD